MIRVMILWGLGFNCEEETSAAYQLAGATISRVHVNELFKDAISIHDFHIVHFPGGFSFGDHLGAGRVLANRIRFKHTRSGQSLREELLRFTQNGGFIFGICNGFQILLALDLLPGNQQNTEPHRVALVANASGQFQDEWVRCRMNQASPLAQLWPDEWIDLPIRHGEGRLLVTDEAAELELSTKNLITMSYADEEGKPYTPNGSFQSCAALCDPSGRILGMMPHPEAFLSAYNHPRWPHLPARDKGQGLLFFENLVKYVGD